MSGPLSSGRRGLLRILTAGAYRSGALRAVRPLANRWEIRRRGGGLPAVRRARSRALHILSYHRVGDRRDGFLDPLPVEIFRRQMAALAGSSVVLPLDEAVDRLREGDLPDDAVAITFDDGYRDNFENAFPVLRDLGLPATIFLVTGSIGTGRPLWHDRVFRGFNATTVDRLDGFWADGPSRSLAGPGERERTRREVLRHLKSLGPERRDAEIGRLLAALGVDDLRQCPGLMLDWDDVRTLRREGVSFGAHTVHHPVLSRVSGERARREIESSKAEIEANLSCVVRAFAYPNGGAGDFDETTKAALREAGIDHALTTMFGTNTTVSDPLELRRINPSAWSASELVARLDYYRMLRSAAS